MNNKTTHDLTGSDFSEDEEDVYGSYNDFNTTHTNGDSDPFSILMGSQEEFHDRTYKTGPDTFSKTGSKRHI